MKSGSGSAATALLLLALALSGCVGEPSAAETEGEGPVVVTSPDDYSYLEANASRGQGEHLHDYWGGKDRLEIMSETQAASTFLIGQTSEFAFRPAGGKVIPQGAAFVDVTFSWTSAPTDTHSAPNLWIKTAADSEARELGPIEQGQTVRFESANELNDLPHQGLSAWEFFFALHPADGSALIWFDGEITILVVAERGLDIPLYPGHPDRWENATEIALFEDSESYFAGDGDPEGSFRCYRACLDRHSPRDGAIVPADAAVVEVVLEFQTQSPTRLGLRFHGADSREFTALAPDEDTGDRRVYRIPVGKGMGDGPYAKQSLWEFLPFIEEPMENGFFAGSYSITARALRSA